MSGGEHGQVTSLTCRNANSSCQSRAPSRSVPFISQVVSQAVGVRQGLVQSKANLPPCLSASASFVLRPVAPATTSLITYPTYIYIYIYISLLSRLPFPP